MSNIEFVSNVYILEGRGKLSDPKFMLQVIDPGAIKAIAEHKRKITGTTGLSPLQNEIYNNSLPCALSEGDYTHGSTRENGQIICVNKCENFSCINYPRCSQSENFRQIVRDENATFDFVGRQNENEQGFEFDIVLPTMKKLNNTFVPKLTDRQLHVPMPTIEIKEIFLNNNVDEWGVRSHIRHLADGSTTIVRAHTRRHQNSIGTRYIIRKPYYQQKIEKLNFINGKLIRRLDEMKAQRVRDNALAASQVYQLKNIKLIDSADIIISSSLSSRTLVNAGPGTGKTHTVIERLKHIVKNYKEIDPDDVLVLCFSRSAVRVIRDRLNKAMDENEISHIAKRFNVLTFDSFATWYLKEIEPEYDLTYLNYDERISRFIQKYEKSPAVLCPEYLIVDEIQDLVGKRAEMVRSLLSHIECGFLLLGDECQAIYDYQIDSDTELNAARLYEWLENYFKDELIEYELTRGWRHQGKLEDVFKPLRHAMQFKPYTVQKDQLSKLFHKFDIPGLDTEDIVCCEDGHRKAAILSWSNGDAYRQSQELFSRDDIDIRHTILTGTRKQLIRKELAMILGGFNAKTVSKTAFFARSRDAGINEKLAIELWDAILFTIDANKECEEFPLGKLKKVLIAEKQVDEALLVSEDADVVVSTIHKAKGKEYDLVVLNKYGIITSSEDIKVYYVGLTRARSELFVKEKRASHSRDIKTECGRFIEFGKNNEYSVNKIKRIEIGIDGDVDPIGFVDEGLLDTDAGRFTPDKRQAYIAKCVKPGDPLKISKYRGQYLIIHEGYVIGRLNSDALKPYKHYYKSGKSYTFTFDKYAELVGAFVKDVVTIVNQKLDSSIPEPYSTNGFWLGIELCGYAKPMEG